MITDVVRKTVLESAVITRGDVVETDAFAVALSGDVGELEGEPVYTGRIAPTGSNVKSGDVLAEISGRPVLALEGDVPMYRHLTIGTVGADVEQLERHLAQRGDLRDEPDTAFDASTAAAVRALYKDLGYQAIESVVSAAGGAADAASPPARQVTVSRGEVVFVPRLPRRVGSTAAVVGQVPSGTAFILRGFEVVVVAHVPRDQASLVHKRDPAELFDDAAGTDTAGRVASVGTRADPQGNIPVRIAAPRDLIRVVGANLRVRIPVSSSKGEVLAVSPAAVFAEADGRSYLELAETDRGGRQRSKRIEVHLGLATEALVEVEPVSAQLRAGDRVVISAR